ncbi:MAG: hypothetical protein JWM96_1221 [Alphaproteobacteria bacterium]|nr:hypothetical protein [Alphaproteobacteria bacterium]
MLKQLFALTASAALAVSCNDNPHHRGIGKLDKVFSKTEEIGIDRETRELLLINKNDTFLLQRTNNAGRVDARLTYQFVDHKEKGLECRTRLERGEQVLDYPFSAGNIVPNLLMAEPETYRADFMRRPDDLAGRNITWIKVEIPKP